MAWSAGSRPGPLFTSPGRVLVGPHDRGVHRDGPAEILVRSGLCHQSGENPLPGAVHGPHPQPAVNTSPVAVLLRQVDPLRAGLKLVGDRFDHLAMVRPVATPLRRPVREQRLDSRPLRISQRHTRTNDQPIQTKLPRSPWPQERCPCFRRSVVGGPRLGSLTLNWSQARRRSIPSHSCVRPRTARTPAPCR